MYTLYKGPNWPVSKVLYMKEHDEKTSVMCYATYGLGTGLEILSMNSR